MDHVDIVQGEQHLQCSGNGGVVVDDEDRGHAANRLCVGV